MRSPGGDALPGSRPPFFSRCSGTAGIRSLRRAWGDLEFRDLVITQGFVTSWCIGWLALVLSYSGGNLVGDWFGHWQRAVFFLERLSPHFLFNGFDPLTSRPPLANLVVGTFMFITKNDFAHYQLGMTVIGSLAFLPAALLARRVGSVSAIRILALLLMVSPLFVQNATYAWTKLPATVFTLAALYWFLRAHDSDEPASARPMVAVNLGAAILTHYSAAPYALVLAIAWLMLGWPRRHQRQWWQTTATCAGIGTLTLAPWFAWALLTYGGRGTFLNNPSITDQAPTAVAQLWAMVLNIRDTIVPHFFRTIDPGWIAQASSWGWWRHWFFNLYQTNLIFAFGSVGWLVILIKLLRNRHHRECHATPFLVRIHHLDQPSGRCGAWQSRRMGSGSHLPATAGNPRSRLPRRRLALARAHLALGSDQRRRPGLRVRDCAPVQHSRISARILDESGHAPRRCQHPLFAGHNGHREGKTTVQLHVSGRSFWRQSHDNTASPGGFGRPCPQLGEPTSEKPSVMSRTDSGILQQRLLAAEPRPRT